MAFPWEAAIQGATGLIGMIGGNSAAKAAKASAYTQRDALFSQLANALSYDEAGRQALGQLAPMFGYNLSWSQQSPDASGKIGGYIPGKFSQPTPTLTAIQGWTPTQNPQFQNLMAQIHAQQQAQLRGVAGVNQAGQLAGHYGAGSTANYYGQRNAEQNNAAAYNYGNQQYAGQQNFLNQIINMAASKNGQTLPATQALGQAGQNLSQAYSQQQLSDAHNLASIFDAIHSAFTPAQTTDEVLGRPTSTNALPPGVGAVPNTAASNFNYYTGGLYGQKNGTGWG